MLNVKAWVYGKLTASAGLVALLGASKQIVFMYPNTFEVLPLVTYQEINQYSLDDGYVDNKAVFYTSIIQIDVWTANDQNTSAISLAVAAVMEGLLFNADYAQDVSDPAEKTQHRVMRFSRKLSAADLV